MERALLQVRQWILIIILIIVGSYRELVLISLYQQTPGLNQEIPSYDFPTATSKKMGVQLARAGGHFKGAPLV